MCGVLPPRLLQGPSPPGGPQCLVVVWMQARSGEVLVNAQNPVTALFMGHHFLQAGNKKPRLATGLTAFIDFPLVRLPHWDYCCKGSHQDVDVPKDCRKLRTYAHFESA